ncbi:MAG: DNA helicase-2/ATP-dependent DNA helicase PcrA [Myxococcota bacterium]|jgi:DNA helicase-2/ATP-dependent DNA helicase PcrA
MNETENKAKTPEPVVEEERLLATVLKVASTQTVERWSFRDAEAEMLRLRDELAEERLAEDRASVLEQMERLSRIVAQQERHHEGVLDPTSPYFGHMRLLDDDGTRRDILIGKQTWIRDGVRIVDWRNAPISKVFYQRSEGEDYELPIAGRVVSGEVMVRRTLTIRDAEIMRVGTEDGTFIRGKNGWTDVSASPLLRGGQGAAVRPSTMKPVLGTHDDGRPVRADKHLPEIASLLDPEQFKLITKPEPGIVAIQGSAGSGKTTVALHRVAYLAFQDPHRFAGSRGLVVVFSLSLARYIEQVLPALGVEGVQVRTFEDWAGRMRQALYPRLVKRYSEDTPVLVSRFKMHSALIPMLDDGFIENDRMSVVGLFDELFTNRSWIRDGLARHAPGVFTENQQDQIYRWCADQFNIRDAGGGMRDYEVPQFDREDDTIFLYLHQLIEGALTGKKGRPIRYSQLVVDEAQDLSPIELKVLLATVDHNGAVTLAGDTAQRVMEDNDFQDWQQVLSAIGQDDVQLSGLKVAYRSTAEIMDLAHHVLGPLAPKEPALAPRHGVAPQLFRFRSRGEELTFLSDALRDLQIAEPHASVAILSAKPWHAAEAWSVLSRGELDNLSWVQNHDFSFRPGIEITDVKMAKGLEFDYVVLLDVDADTYPPNSNSRHILHVGITRAAHQLWLLTVGTPSHLLGDYMTATEI